MRSLILLFGCMFSMPSWAEEAPPQTPEEADTDSPADPASSTESEAEPAPPKPVDSETSVPVQSPVDSGATSAVISDVPMWEYDYERGLHTARVGVTMGWAGLASAVAGGVMLGVGLERKGGGHVSSRGEGQIVAGLATGVLGLLSIQVGAPVAAYGTGDSRRALVNGGQADRGCHRCVVAALLSVPNPLSLITLPLSYSVSSAQRRSDQIRYHRYKGFGAPPRVGVSPKGVGLRWQF